MQLPEAEVYALREANGYGVIKLVDAVVEKQVVWGAPWPPPEEMLLILPVLNAPTILEMPEEVEQLEAMRTGVSLGWSIFRLERGSYSTIGDDKAKEMSNVVRIAEYHQREVFEP